MPDGSGFKNEEMDWNEKSAFGVFTVFNTYLISILKPSFYAILLLTLHQSIFKIEEVTFSAFTYYSLLQSGAMFIVAL